MYDIYIYIYYIYIYIYIYASEAAGLAAPLPGGHTNMLVV